MIGSSKIIEFLKHKMYKQKLIIITIKKDS